ncbi:hypothetical protein LTR37_017970 [Vermiconidia calcicola]|uniref:Uncharacterized protein n=1 Tax=Vermiconidia calcicola TaxID=1690605 RepID=A0ACC3MJX4_9PEZI|nr:hypothetical protein LTR37_017970 [Vermiconidia calcicola]
MPIYSNNLSAFEEIKRFSKNFKDRAKLYVDRILLEDEIAKAKKVDEDKASSRMFERDEDESDVDESDVEDEENGWTGIPKGVPMNDEYRLATATGPIQTIYGRGQRKAAEKSVLLQDIASRAVRNARDGLRVATENGLKYAGGKAGDATASKAARRMLQQYTAVAVAKDELLRRSGATGEGDAARSPPDSSPPPARTTAPVVGQHGGEVEKVPYLRDDPYWHHVEQ